MFSTFEAGTEKGMVIPFLHVCFWWALVCIALAHFSTAMVEVGHIALCIKTSDGLSICDMLPMSRAFHG
jgi:hypothetical protein